MRLRNATIHRIGVGIVVSVLLLPAWARAGYVGTTQSRGTDPSVVPQNAKDPDNPERREHTFPDNPVFERALYARSKYDLEATLTYANECEHRSFRSKAMLQAYFCNTMAFNAALYMGDASAAIQQLEWAKQVLFTDPSAPAQGIKPEFGNGLDQININKLKASVPKFSASVFAGKSVLPYVHVNPAGLGSDSENWRRFPEIEIAINGKAANASVDTGMSTTPIEMDEQTAKTLGLKPLATGLPPVATLDGVDATGTSSLQLINTLEFGTLRMRNVMARVVSNRGISPHVIIGLPALARFRTVEFRRDALVLSTVGVACRNWLPLETVKPGVGAQLLFDAKVDGKSIKASIDTGASELLVAARGLAPPGMAANGGAATAHSSDQTVLGRRYLSVSIGEMHVDAAGAPIATRLVGADVLIGAPILKNYAVRFDFLKPALCLVPNDTGTSIGGP